MSQEDSLLVKNVKKTALSTSYFPGNSELAILMRNYDWAASELGSPEHWPQPLTTALAICLMSQFPLIICWGPNLNLFYNDAYISFLGPHKHPAALGRPLREVWPEIWDTIDPIVAGVVSESRANSAEDMLFFFERYAEKEEVYVSFSCSPILLGEKVGGIFCACTETTDKIINNRRLDTLRKLAIRGTRLDSVAEACIKSANVLAHNLWDIPFSAIYLHDNNLEQINLSATSGLSENQIPLLAQQFISNDNPSSLSSFMPVLTKSSSTLIDLKKLGLNLLGGHWPEACHEALVLPLASFTPNDAPIGLIIIGISPRRPFDIQYHSFLELVAKYITTNINDVKAYKTAHSKTKELEKLNQTQAIFFNKVSQKFQTPLMLISSHLEESISALSEKNESDALLSLQKVHRDASKLLKLINTLLEFSRIEADRVQPKFELTDIVTFTNKTINSLRPMMELADLEFNLEISSIDPVYIDREMWKKIINHLLSHAIEIITADKISLSLYSQGQDLYLKMAHNKYIDSEKLSILLSFSASASSDFKRGLKTADLAMVRELVHTHDGNFTVESMPNIGTSYVVCLPKRQSTVALTRLNELSLRLISQDGLPALLESVIDAAMDLTGAAFGHFQLFDTASETLKLVAQRHLSPDFIEYLSMTKPGQFTSGEAVQAGQRIIINNLSMRPMVNSKANEIIKSTGACAMQTTPLFARDNKLLGVLTTYWDHPFYPDESTLRILDLLSRMAADLIEHRQREEALRQAKEKAENVNFAKDLFMAMLSHELRTPLTALLCWTQILKTGKLDAAKTLEGIKCIEENALAQNKLIEDLLDISSIILGKISIAMEANDIIPIIQKTLDSIRATADNKNLLLTTQLPNTPITVLADASRLRQVFANLLSNSIKFTPEGGKIIIAAEIFGQHGDKKVRVIISDTGIGIKPEFLPYIFDRFQQGSMSHSYFYKGLGLGLTIAKNLIELQKGSIQAISEGENKGATFIITLPYYSEA